MNLLRLYRQRTGLSQSALARRLGVTQAMVGRWERGAKITADRALALERELGIPAERLSKTLLDFESSKRRRTGREHETP